MRLPQVKRSPPSLKTASTCKDRRVIVVGDSLLQGTEGPICRPDPTRREVCCLPGARVRDISKIIPGLIQPSDYYPLLIIQACGKEIDKESLRSIKKDFRRMGRLLEGAGVQVVFSSTPMVSGKGTGRIQKTQLLNRWLKSWCRHMNFGFFDHGTIYTALGMMAADASSLSLRGKRILAEELAGLQLVPTWVPPGERLLPEILRRPRQGSRSHRNGRQQPRRLQRPRLRSCTRLIGRLLPKCLRKLRLSPQPKMLVCRSLAVLSARAWPLQCWVREAVIVFTVTR